jgi:hypothetical protein
VSAPTCSDYIRQIAPYYGVDPNAAIAIFNKETGGNSNFIGGMGSSFGRFQLHYGGMVPKVLRSNNPGLGDEFAAATGLNASDSSTWHAQVDFSLYKASTGGWTPWSTMSAAGLHKWSGMPAAASLHKTGNHMISAGTLFRFNRHFPRLAGLRPPLGQTMT